MKLGREQKTVTVGGVGYTVEAWFWQDIDTGEKFTTLEQGDRLLLEIARVTSGPLETLCDVWGCSGLATCGGTAWKEAGYWLLCDQHFMAGLRDEPAPHMRPDAVTREARRKGGILDG